MKLLAFIHEKRYKIIRVWIGPYPSIWITHCEAVGKLLKEPKPEWYLSWKPWVGESVFLAEGKKWQSKRNLLSKAFYNDILSGYVPVFNSCLQILIKKWRNSATSLESVFAFKDIGKLTLDIIMRCAFSSESNCQLSDSHQYINSVSALKTLLLDRRQSIFSDTKLDFVYYNFTCQGRKFKQICQMVHEYTEGVIRERKKALKIAKKRTMSEAITEQRAGKCNKKLDLLDVLLTTRDEDGNGLTDLEIREETDTFLFAGHDTTSSGISWTLYCLAKYPEHQDKVREEVREVLMEREWLEYEDLKKLKYTTWCIKEAMRLYPPATDFVRSTTQDRDIDGHMIPKGMLVLLNTFLIHRHPDTWENPNEYDPLRFNPSNSEGRHPHAFIPFASGYHNCIGQNFALIEVKTVIATIINEFQITLDETCKVEMEMGFILLAKNDIKLQLKALTLTV